MVYVNLVNQFPARQFTVFCSGQWKSNSGDGSLQHGMFKCPISLRHQHPGIEAFPNNAWTKASHRAHITTLGIGARTKQNSLMTSKWQSRCWTWDKNTHSERGGIGWFWQQRRLCRRARSGDHCLRVSDTDWSGQVAKWKKRFKTSPLMLPNRSSVHQSLSLDADCWMVRQGHHYRLLSCGP